MFYAFLLIQLMCLNVPHTYIQSEVFAPYDYFKFRGILPFEMLIYTSNNNISLFRCFKNAN